MKVFHALLVVLTLGNMAQAGAESAAKTALLGKSNRTASSLRGIEAEMTYSKNSLCRQNYCINPVFPGLNDLPRLEQLEWQCATQEMVTNYLDFCSGAIQYNPALPSPVETATPVDDLVKAQDDAAMTMFFYHLSGMGYDAWDYQEPRTSDNECVRTIWKMVCYTYFPRSAAGCKTGEQSNYFRPCMSSCENYIKQCGVECCDESVSCVFTHTGTAPNGTLQLLQTGYVDALGPSATCTGGARRSASSSLLLLLGLLGLHIFAGEHSTRPSRAVPCKTRAGHSNFRYVLAATCLSLALMLQGCDIVIPKHTVGNWRTEVDYLHQFKYVPPGKPSSKAELNSCSLDGIPLTEQCSGKGFCRSFSKSSIQAQRLTPLAFCQCDRNWAGPECTIKRKSQTVAFLLSLFFGCFGADYFYLGFPLWGLGKLFTAGGFGFWWLFDIVRTGAGPVYAYKYRTAADLPHWIAMLATISFFVIYGFLVAIEGYLLFRRKKHRDLANLSNKEEERHLQNTEAQLGGLDGSRYVVEGPATFGHRMGFSGYGATLPVPYPNGGVPRADRRGKDDKWPYAGPHGPYGDFQTPTDWEPARTQSDLPNFGIRHGRL
mmetsp:Transcript_131868/g.239779  ORF Transcript_131868/g.239779 Transcript_131868/m.239779 type:complete len:601 (+) Transcript_131868:124-1926(+)